MSKNSNDHPGSQANDSSDPATSSPNATGNAPGGTVPPPPQDSPPAGSPDPFDPAALRLSQDFGANLGIKKALLTVPVRKPGNEWWVRVHPAAEYQLQTAVLDLKEDNEVYLVDRSLWPELASEPTFSPRALFTAMTRQGVLFLWPVRLPRADGRIDAWSESALEAATMAQSIWCRVAANMQLGAYEVNQASCPDPAPSWPAMPFKELLRVAFKGRFVDTLNHPALRKLRGEV